MAGVYGQKPFLFDSRISSQPQNALGSFALADADGEGVFQHREGVFVGDVVADEDELWSVAEFD